MAGIATVAGSSGGEGVDECNDACQYVTEDKRRGSGLIERYAFVVWVYVEVGPQATMVFIDGFPERVGQERQ